MPSFCQDYLSMTGFPVLKPFVLWLLWTTTVEASNDNLISVSETIFQNIKRSSQYSYDIIWATFVNQFSRITQGQLGVWDMVQLLAACSLLQALRLLRKRTTNVEGNTSPGDRPCNIYERDSISISGNTRHIGIFSGSAKTGESFLPTVTQ